MKRFIFLLLIVAALPWSTTAQSAQAADPLGDSARQSGKPLIADFGMNQCKQCIKQTEAIDKFRPDAGDRLTLRFIHVAKEADLAGAYKIVLIPTLIFFDKQGKEVFRQVGLMPYDELRAKSRELGFLP